MIAFGSTSWAAGHRDALICGVIRKIILPAKRIIAAIVHRQRRWVPYVKSKIASSRRTAGDGIDGGGRAS